MAAAAREQVLTDRWGSRTDALSRLSAVSRQLELLRAEELALLDERDGLIVALRGVNVPRTNLAGRTRLSRQALNKQLAMAEGSD